MNSFLNAYGYTRDIILALLPTLCVVFVLYYTIYQSLTTYYMLGCTLFLLTYLLLPSKIKVLFIALSQLTLLWHAR